MDEIYLIHMICEKDYYSSENEYRIFEEQERFKREVLNILGSDKVYSFRLYKLSLYSPKTDNIRDKPLTEFKPEIVNNELVFKTILPKKTDSPIPF